MDPGADLLRRPAAGALAAVAGRLLGVGVVDQVKDDQAGAEDLEEVAAIELEVIGRAFAELEPLGLDDNGLVASRGVHREASFIDRAALVMAAMTRG